MPCHALCQPYGLSYLKRLFTFKSAFEISLLDFCAALFLSGEDI
jgi:hypothetical protein